MSMSVTHVTFIPRFTITTITSFFFCFVSNKTTILKEQDPKRDGPCTDEWTIAQPLGVQMKRSFLEICSQNA